MGRLVRLAKTLPPTDRVNPHASDDAPIWDDVLDLDSPRPNGTRQGNTKTDSDYHKAARNRNTAKAKAAEEKGELPAWRMRMEKAVEEVCKGTSYSRAAKNNFLTSSEVRRWCLKYGVRSPDQGEVRSKVMRVAVAYDLAKRLELSNAAFDRLEELLPNVGTPEQMRSWSNAFGILIDKRRLEEGQATFRIETLNGGAKNVLESRIKELAARNDDKSTIEAQSRTLEDSRPLTEEELKDQQDQQSFIPEEGTYEGTFQVIHPNQAHRSADGLRINETSGMELTQADIDRQSTPTLTPSGEEDWEHLNDHVNVVDAEETDVDVPVLA